MTSVRLIRRLCASYRPAATSSSFIFSSASWETPVAGKEASFVPPLPSGVDRRILCLQILLQRIAGLFVEIYGGYEGRKILELSVPRSVYLFRDNIPYQVFITFFARENKKAASGEAA